jgi:regulatory protein
MTSDPVARSSSDPWSGDVAEGVAAWTGSDRRSHTARSAEPAPGDVRRADPDADAEDVARTILLGQLTGRARSRRELADALARRNVPGDVAMRLLDRFEEVGLVDDAAFAHSWVAGRVASKGLAPRALAHELRRKGVDDEVAREALDGIGEDEQETAARALVRRRLRSMGRLDDTTRTRRLVGMLARKGYEAGVAHRVVREELVSSQAPGWSGADAD